MLNLKIKNLLCQKLLKNKLLYYIMSISVNSPVRCGSTLIYNIVKEFFPDVIKSHANKFKSNPPNRKIFYSNDINNKVIFVYRHPYDSIISISQCNKLDLNIYLDKCIKEYINSIKPFIETYKSNHILKLKYENFHNNYKYIYDKLEKYFDIKINKKKRIEINNKFSIQNVQQIMVKYNTFNKHDQETQIHGNHISNDKGKIGKWNKLNNKELTIIKIQLINALGINFFNLFMKENDYNF